MNDDKDKQEIENIIIQAIKPYYHFRRADNKPELSISKAAMLIMGLMEQKKQEWQRQAVESEKKKASAVALCPQCNDWMHRKDLENEYYCFGCDKTFNLTCQTILEES